MYDNKREMKYQQHQRAFTLLEMMIVIALLGILAIVLLPSWKGLSRATSLRGTTTLLLSSFEEARLNAIQHHTETWVLFQHTADYDRYCTLQRGEDEKMQLLTSWIRLPTGITFDTTSESIMTVPPSLKMMEMLSERPLQGEGMLGLLSYNGQGGILFPDTHLLLALTTQSQKIILRSEIIFSPTTGRALLKKEK